MNIRKALIAISFFAAIAVWYCQKPELPVRRVSLDPETAMGDSSPGVRSPMDAEKLSQRLQKVREFSLLLDRAMKKNLSSRSPDDPDPSADTTTPSENELIKAEDNMPEQRVWRSTWFHESQDDDWTQRMRKEVNEKVNSLLAGDVEINHLSCRETVCRMYLQFKDKLDAEAFTSAPYAPDLHYEYQLLNPNADSDSSHESRYNYEVLVKRARPADLPQTIRPLMPDPTEPVESEG
jgi:hypothetical protein